MKKIASIVVAAAFGIVLGVACGGSSKAADESTMPENTGGTMESPETEGMGEGMGADDMGAGDMGGDTYGGAAYGGDAYGGGW